MKNCNTASLDYPRPLPGLVLPGLPKTMNTNAQMQCGLPTPNWDNSLIIYCIKELVNSGMMVALRTCKYQRKLLGAIPMTSTRHKLNLQSINFCIPGLLSKCSAGVTWKEHRVCRFAIKSRFADRCMYYSESIDGHCGCLAAQKEAMTLVED